MNEDNFDYMLDLAKRIMKKNPEYFLCGSVALIHSGAIKRRNVGDLDFIVPIDRFIESKLKLDPEYGVQNHNGYTCYKTTGDQNGMYYNVFVHDDSSKIKAKMISGIKCQSIDQIIEWKKEFGRVKDLDDLKIKRPAFL